MCKIKTWKLEERKRRQYTHQRGATRQCWGWQVHDVITVAYDWWLRVSVAEQLA